MCLCEIKYQKGVSHRFGELLTSLKSIARYGVSQRYYRNIARHGATKRLRFRFFTTTGTCCPSVAPSSPSVLPPSFLLRPASPPSRFLSFCFSDSFFCPSLLLVTLFRSFSFRASSCTGKHQNLLVEDCSLLLSKWRKPAKHRSEKTKHQCNKYCPKNRKSKREISLTEAEQVADKNCNQPTICKTKSSGESVNTSMETLMPTKKQTFQLRISTATPEFRVS